MIGYLRGDGRSPGRERNMNRTEAMGKRIADARKRRRMTQEQLGEKLGVSFQAVSTWEQGRFMPDSEHLPALARELDLSLDVLFDGEGPEWELKPVNFDFNHMYTFVKGRAQMMKWKQTLAVLDMLRPVHGSQIRGSRNGFETSYMVHPLTLACHALAMGLREDDIIAACLAHDMVEDGEGITPEKLPVNDRVREAVRLVSWNTYTGRRSEIEEIYFGNIRKNPLACLIKCLDRTNNLAGMADCFTREKMRRYVKETDRYYPPLLDVIKKVPEWNDAWWLLRYQMISLLEAFKRLL